MPYLQILFDEWYKVVYKHLNAGKLQAYIYRLGFHLQAELGLSFTWELCQE